MESLKKSYQDFIIFLNNVVCLKSALALPYLMMINFTFCFVSFYLSREWQCRIIFGMILSIPSWNFLFCPHNKAPIFDLLLWFANDYLKTGSTVLFIASLIKLKSDEELWAFFSALTGASILVLSPAYNCNNIHARIINQLTGILNKLKEFFICWILLPLSRAFEWVKWIMMLKWVPILVQYLRNCFLQFYATVDSMVFVHFRNFFRHVSSVFRYIFYLHWLRDIFERLKHDIFRPLGRCFGRLYEGLVYIFGCYWIKPLLKRLSQLSLRILSWGARIAKRAMIYMLSLTIVHIIKPFVMILWEQTKVVMAEVHKLLLKPFFLLCYAKYKLLEDLVLIYILGPFFKKVLDSLPEKNPFSCESDDAELVEFIPETDLNEGSDEADINQNMPIDDFNEASSIGSIDSLGDSNLAKGLHMINISCSDSEDSEFLPIPLRRQHSKRKRDQPNR